MKVKHNTYTISESTALLYALNQRKDDQTRAERRQELWKKKSQIFPTKRDKPSLLSIIQATLAKAVYKLWKKGYFSQFPEFVSPESPTNSTDGPPSQKQS